MLRMSKSVLVACMMAIVGCGGEEAVQPVAPEAIAPGTPTAAVPGANTPAQPVAAPGTPSAVAPAPVAPANTANTAPGAGPNYGTVTLNPGFMPDPSTANGVSGGTVSASSLNPSCRGYISAVPDHIFMAGGQFGNLRVMVNGGTADTTLVIQGPDGVYRCNDDAEGRNPLWGGAFPPGSYKVWVGSYRQGENAPYTLGFSELSSVTPSSLPAPSGGAAVPSQPSQPTTPASAEMAFALSPGFMPDPKVLSGTAGGPQSASQFNPMCRGWIAATPNHVMTLNGQSNFLSLIANSSADTTLVVRKPDGTYLCDDDGAGGTNPMVSGTFAPGIYNIFVGVYSPGTTATYRLGVSELRSTTAATIGTP